MSSLLVIFLSTKTNIYSRQFIEFIDLELPSGGPWRTRNFWLLVKVLLLSLLRDCTRHKQVVRGKDEWVVRALCNLKETRLPRLRTRIFKGVWLLVIPSAIALGGGRGMWQNSWRDPPPWQWACVYYPELWCVDPIRNSLWCVWVRERAAGGALWNSEIPRTPRSENMGPPRSPGRPSIIPALGFNFFLMRGKNRGGG